MLKDRADSTRKTLSSLITSFVRQRMRAESFSLVVTVCRERHFHSLEPSTNVERGRIHVGSSEGSQAENGIEHWQWRKKESEECIGQYVRKTHLQ